jgi:hypothetical protein
MGYYLLKIVVTTLIIVIISEISKRSSLMGSILASIPLISVLAMTWLYIDTRDVAKVVDLSHSILWLIVPSLTLFVALPVLIKKGIGFFPSMALSILLTVLAYYAMIYAAGKLGYRL